VVSSERSSKTRRWRGGFQEKPHKSERTQKDKGLCSELDGSKKYQNTEGIGEEREMLGDRVQPDEGDEENDLTRARERNQVLARGLPISKALILDQAVDDQLPQLILRGAWSRLDLLCSPHGNELLDLNHLEQLFLVHQDLLQLAR
jgi:hypothetical protein